MQVPAEGEHHRPKNRFFRRPQGNAEKSRRNAQYQRIGHDVFQQLLSIQLSAVGTIDGQGHHRQHIQQGHADRRYDRRHLNCLLSAQSLGQGNADDRRIAAKCALQQRTLAPWFPGESGRQKIPQQKNDQHHSRPVQCQIPGHAGKRLNRVGIRKQHQRDQQPEHQFIASGDKFLCQKAALPEPIPQGDQQHNGQNGIDRGHKDRQHFCSPVFSFSLRAA